MTYLEGVMTLQRDVYDLPGGFYDYKRDLLDNMRVFMTIWKCLYGTSEGVRGMIEGSYDLPREVYDASEGVYRTIGECYDLPGGAYGMIEGCF